MDCDRGPFEKSMWYAANCVLLALAALHAAVSSCIRSFMLTRTLVSTVALLETVTGARARTICAEDDADVDEVD